MAEFSIAQSSQYRGGDYWDWAVWIDATPKALSTIERVVWLLHPTFPNPHVVSENAKKKFRLDSAGWGTFEIVARVQPKAGRTFKLKHMLQFEVPAPQKPLPRTRKKAEKKPQVVLSFAAADATAAEEVRAALESHGIEVLEPSATAGSVPASLLATITGAQGLVSLNNPLHPSRWVDAERDCAERLARPILTIDATSKPGDARTVLDSVATFVQTLTSRQK
jgi:hypothetical protein